MTKIKKTLSILFTAPLVGLFPLTGCSLNNKWSWKASTKDNTEINYCLLIGQNDHPDSIERTRYTRMALDTYDKEGTEKVKGNANLAKPKQGTLPYDKSDPEGTKGSFKVTELEHMEQKSMAGAAWDAITANSTSSAWTAKHGGNITFFVSNNDSMAEAAIWAGNWMKGMPIFGYDGNPSTIQMIKNGLITGTVDQNASAQCSTAMMILRNMLEDKDLYLEGKTTECHDFGLETYTPIDNVHFFDDGGQFSTEAYEASPYGYVNSYFHTENSEMAYQSKRQILAKSTAIAGVKNDTPGWAYNNVDTYLREDGEPKQAKDLFDEFTHIKQIDSSKKTYKICQTYANRAETYLVSTLRPYFNEYAKRLNLDIEIVEGDGTGESVVIDQLKSKPDGKFDAYLINMAKTTATIEYIKAIAQKVCQKEKQISSVPENGWEDFSQRLNTPIIFYNRQPQTDESEVDKASMNNKFFKYTYFVGVDAPKGGEVQGAMIVDLIRFMYERSIK